jgi:ubiquitin-protein ligase
MWSGLKACDKDSVVLPATQRRLLADLKRLQEEPIPLAAAQPCSDEDLTLWDGVVGVEMEVTHFGCVTVPLHFLIDFPGDYPQSAPNIGFSFEFQYRGGAQYVMPDGRLKGKKVICLDVLGNFGNIHREWKHTVGSGWSPAYTVTTLLVQLQSVLCDLGNQMSQHERDITYQSAMRFCEHNPLAVLVLLGEDEIREQREERRATSSLLKIQKICKGDAALTQRIQDFANEVGFSGDADHLAKFLSLLIDVAAGSANSTSCGESDTACSDVESEVDKNICCFATGKLYTEALLGVGVSRERRNLSTAGELLSKEAFDGGLRQSTDKSPFEFFLPVWINETHAASNVAWCEALKNSYMKIAHQAYQVTDEDEAILEVFPRLINQMIVEMMKPDAAKSAAIATFEAMCNFWRTLRWLVDLRPTLLKRIRAMLSKFVKDEDSRHKDVTPDLGVALVLFTVFQGQEGCPTRKDFINAYADENALRCVMWWQRSGTRPEPTPVFEATQVSREICMFQMMVVDVIIADVGTTLKLMEDTNCKMTDRLEKLQVQWRNQKSSIQGWAEYFKCIDASPPAFPSESAWIVDCVSRAAAKGPKYGGKGDAKGGNGKGVGKGGSKGGYKNGGKGWGR